MKVLHLVDHLGPGGEQRIVADLVATRGRDVEPSVWSLSRRALSGLVDEIRSAGAALRLLGLAKAWPGSLLRLRRELGREAPDVLHLHLEFSGTFGAAAALSLGARRPIVVVSVVNDPRTRYHPVHRVGGRALAPHLDAHVAVSPSIASSLSAAYRGRMRRLEVITPGIDVARFADPGPPDGPIAARAAALRGGARRVVGAVGRLAEQKAFHRLLEAAPGLLAAEPSTRILLVGEGPLRSRLERLARGLGVAEAVTFTGHLDDPRPAFRAMDVLVLPSLDEGYGLVFLEAMASGVPVVATRVVGTVDAVRHEETGLLVPSGDVPALAAAVLRVLEDGKLAAELRRRASAWVAGRRRELTTAAHESLYRDLLAHRGRGRSAAVRGAARAATPPPVAAG